MRFPLLEIQFNKKIYDYNSFKSKYYEITHFFKRIAEQMVLDIKDQLAREKIDLIECGFRIKDYNSFILKILRLERNNFAKNPFKMDDICGIKIIPCFSSDIKKIATILEESTNLLSILKKKSIKYEYYEADHFIVKASQFREECHIRDKIKPDIVRMFKTEIQVKSVGMNTLTEITHILTYKKAENFPRILTSLIMNMKTKISELDSLILEFKRARIDLIKSSNDYYKLKDFSKLEGDLMSFQLLIDHFISPYQIDMLDDDLDKNNRRLKDFKNTAELYVEIKRIGVDIVQIPKYLEKNLDLTLQLEQEIFQKKMWSQTGVMRVLLALSDDDYYNYPSGYKEIILEHNNPDWLPIYEKYRKKIRETKF